MLRIGALGNSRILKRFIGAPEKSSFGRIGVLATRSPESALLAQESYPDREIVIGYAAALMRKHLEAIYICLPTALHFKWAKAALEAGKHVLIEKPAVMSVSEGKILAQIAQENNLLLMEAWWYRFHPLVQSLRQLVSSGNLGAIRYIASNFSYINPDPKDSRWSADLGGGALYDMFTYHIDFLNYVMGIREGDIKLVQAFSSLKHGVDAAISAELVTKTGIVCNFMAGLDRPSLCKTFICGEKGSVEIPHLRVMPEFNESSYTHFSHLGAQTINFAPIDSYGLMLDAFSLACKRGEESPIPIDQTIENTQLIERIKIARDE
jgi:xylose dehydrogenase (NAD/NADP)